MIDKKHTLDEWVALMKKAFDTVPETTFRANTILVSSATERQISNSDITAEMGKLADKYFKKPDDR